MLAMDQIHHIRALYYEQGYNISEIAKATGRDWKTVAKYIDMTDFNEPLPVPESEKRFCPKLEPYKSLIDSWLKEDLNHPRKQRHTATRVFNRLTDEVPGFDCSYRLVAEYVKFSKEQHDLKRNEGYLPLNHDPDSLKSLYNSLFSDVPQLPPLTTGDMISELDPMPVNLEDYDCFLKGGDLSA